MFNLSSKAIQLFTKNIVQHVMTKFGKYVHSSKKNDTEGHKYIKSSQFMSFDINYLTLMHNIAKKNFPHGVLNFGIYFFLSFSKLFGQKIDTEGYKLDKNNACVHLHQFS